MIPKSSACFNTVWFRQAEFALRTQPTTVFLFQREIMDNLSRSTVYLRNEVLIQRRTMEKIALVTGGNRGIGLAVCRGLAQMGLKVIMGSRNGEAGVQAAEELRDEGFEVDTHQLDVTDQDSVAALKDYVTEKYGRLDVLVNNAAVHLDTSKSFLNIPIEMIHETYETNVYGALRLCQAFIPMMKINKYGRVVNVSSDMGSISQMSGRSGAYRTSKAAINAMTVVLSSEVRGDNIKVNTMSPGWVRTDMGGPSAPRSPEEGADTVLWLATLPEDGPTGGFFKDRKSFPW
jgi:NAD(P)-dependent dehydrogenase (short-subunit alcohol dehydrogenase family)